MDVVRPFARGLALPAQNGVEATRRIRAISPRTQILIFTMHDKAAVIREALSAGVRGYLLKSAADMHLFAAVDALLKGEPYFTGQIDETLLHAYLSNGARGSRGRSMTAREREIVQLITEKHSRKQACQTLNVSLKTVDAHRASARQKLNLDGTAAMARYAIRNSFVES